MKTINISELLAPLPAAQLLGWLEHGEEITLQRAGRTVGRIVPEPVPEPAQVPPSVRPKVDYAARAAAITRGRVVDTISLIAEARGRY